MIHAETHKKKHAKKHFADGQLTTAAKSLYKLYTHIHRLHEIMLVVVQHMNKTKYVITYVTMGDCVPRPSVFDLYPQPSDLDPSTLGPHFGGPWPQKYCKNKFMNITYYYLRSYLFKIKTHLFRIF